MLQQPPPATAVAAAADPTVGAAGAPHGDHLPLLGRRQSAGLRGARWRPLPTSGRVPPRRQRLPLVRAAVDAAVAVGGAPPTPASGVHVGDCHHRPHGRLPRLLFSDLPLVRGLPSGAGREAVLDLPIHLSSCENSFIVLQVQGVFVNALSVRGSGCSEVFIIMHHNCIPFGLRFSHSGVTNETKRGSSRATAHHALLWRDQLPVEPQVGLCRGCQRAAWSVCALSLPCAALGPPTGCVARPGARPSAARSSTARRAGRRQPTFSAACQCLRRPPPLCARCCRLPRRLSRRPKSLQGGVLVTLPPPPDWRGTPNQPLPLPVCC